MKSYHTIKTKVPHVKEKRKEDLNMRMKN